MLISILIFITSLAAENSEIYLLFRIPSIKLSLGYLLLFLSTLIYHFQVFNFIILAIKSFKLWCLYQVPIRMYASNYRLKNIAYFILTEAKQSMRTPRYWGWARIKDIIAINLDFLKLYHLFGFRFLRQFHLRKHILNITISIRESWWGWI